eukprot:SAG31_NODE_4814_length_2942_cov_2.731759_3_plen_199_part_00
MLYTDRDGNANDNLSLAEVDGHLRSALEAKYPTQDEGKLIWRYFRPCFIRAFIDAADAVPSRKPRMAVKTATGKKKVLKNDDFIQLSEFRLLLLYLRLYAQMYYYFALVDGMGDGVTKDDDRKISPQEWIASLPHIKAAANLPFVIPFVAFQNVVAEDFKVMDADGGGSVWLIEWCEWIENAEKTAGTTIGKELSIGD